MKLSQIAYNQMLDRAILDGKVSLEKANILKWKYDQELLAREKETNNGH